MKKVVSYLRVSSSSQKEEGFSIPAQRELLNDFAKKNDFKIVKEFEDDETAKQSGRAGFDEMIAFLRENKDVETILVEKTDRLYRNFKDYVTIEELEATVYLVKESEIIGKNATSHQKFIHGIKVLMAKNYCDNLSEEVKKGNTQKIKSGLYPASVVPLGYQREKQDGKAVIVPNEANRGLVVQIFEDYSTGMYSLETLGQKIKKEYINIDSGDSRLKKINKNSLQRILRNPIYYGDFTWKEKVYHGVHTPLVSKDLWDNAQKVLDRVANKEMMSKYNTLMFIFKGLLVCGECGRSITAERKIKPSGKEYVYYRCTHYNTNCQQKPVQESIIEETIKESLKNLEMGNEDIELIKDGLRESLEEKKSTEDKQHESLVGEKMKLQKRLNVIYEDRLDEKIQEEFYDEKFNEYTTRIEYLEDEINKRTQADIDYFQLGSNILELCQKASILYENANIEERRGLLSFLLSNSTLKDGKPQFNYKKPFDRVLVSATCGDRRE